MRVLGIVLVVVGAFALAYQSFGFMIFDRAADVTRDTARRIRPAVSPLIAGGIAVATGLILVAAAGKRDE